MGYLDYAGLSYFWGKLKEKFAPKSHNHDDRYYTESEMNTKLGSKVDNSQNGASDLIGKLESGSAAPTDDDLMITQWANHKNDPGHDNIYVRRPMSSLWSYVKGKADSVYQPKGSYAASGHTHKKADITDFPTSMPANGGNATTAQKIQTYKAGSTTETYGSSYPVYAQWQDSNIVALKCDNYTTKVDSATSASSATKATSADSSGKLTMGDAQTALSGATSPTAGLTVNKVYNNGYPISYGNVISVHGSGSGQILAGWSGTSGAVERLYYRNKRDTSDANWSAWKTVAYTDDKPATAGTADTAKKLSTSAGSATQPVYFKDGVPVATTYTLNKTVPADAKFTDTNTWRGIQNNLTSDSTDQSLSAAQGKVLKGLVDGKLGKTEKASSATTADKATKLAASHTVSGGSDITLNFNYDGSGNSSANIGFYNCNHIVQNTNNYPFHRFAKLDANKGAYVDHSMTFLINQDYSGGGYGICRLVYRSNADSSSASVSAEWLVRKGLSADSVQVAIKTDKTNGAYCDAFYKSGGTYNGCSIRALASGGRASQSRTWTLIGSIEASGTTTSDKKNSSECWKSIAEAGTALHNQAYSSTASAVDSGYVNSAGTASSCTGNATTATGVKDYGDTNKTIKIGYAGAGLTTSNLTHIAGYTNNGTQIKDVSKTVLQDWIDLNGMINKLSEGTSDPQDNDYYISQYAGGGTTTTTYHRRPVKALWNYIKGKADGVYLKLTGGTISGRITRDSGGSWISSRDQVAVFGTKSSKDSFNPVVGQKTPNGAWAMGNLGSDERLCFGYTTDANYNAGSNNAVQVWLPAQAGTIITSATIGSQTVNKALCVQDYNNANNVIKIGWSGSDLDASTLAYIAGYTSDMKIHTASKAGVRSWIGLGDAAYKKVKTATGVTTTGWTNNTTDDAIVPTMSFMAYWNGAYSETSSNLQYCGRGRFGTIVTKGSGDYLPIGGGTLTGDLKFSDIGDTATSHKISWGGSTDGASIYYQTTAKDQGNLVLNCTDDANCYIRIAYNGAFKSYFSPSDGNFHGNVNGNASSASGFTFKTQTSDPGANSSLATGTVLLVYE